MNKYVARLLFCGFPALCVFAVASLLFHWSMGLIFGGCLFGLGWDVTKDRP